MKIWLSLAEANMISLGTFDSETKQFVTRIKEYPENIGTAEILNEAAAFLGTNSTSAILVFGNRGSAIKAQATAKALRINETIDECIEKITQYADEKLLSAAANFAEACYQHKNFEVIKASTLRRWEVVPNELANKEVKTITFKKGVSEDNNWVCFENTMLSGTYQVYSLGSGRYAVPRRYKAYLASGTVEEIEAAEAIGRNDVDWALKDIPKLDALELFLNLPKLQRKRQSLTASK